MRTLSAPRAPIALLMLTAAMAACSSSGAATNAAGAPAAGGASAGAASNHALALRNSAYGPAARPASGGSSNLGDSSGSGAGQGVPQLYDINMANLLIIKTGTLDLQVAGIDPALAAASAKVVALGGYASGSQRSGDGEAASAQVTYRIPSARWDEALVALRAIGSKVLGEQSQTDDVTGQVVDLGARITNLQATETALQAIMAKADKIADVLAVQSQLTDVRGQIEQLTAERKHLQEQAAFSTLTVGFSLKAIAIESVSKGFDPAGEVDQASASLVGVLQGLATAGIWFGIVWLPILLAIGIVAAIVLFVVRRVTPARPGGPDEGPDADGDSGAGSDTGSIPALPDAPAA